MVYTHPPSYFLHLFLAHKHTRRFYQTLLVALVVFCSLGLSTDSYAQPSKTVYVSDVLFVPMRSGKGNQFRIINAAMKSGTQLKELDVSEDGEWTQVETLKGTQGWIRTQYLSPAVPARERLSKALNENAKLKAENLELESTLNTLKKNNGQLKQDLQSNNGNQAKLSSELERIKNISANAIRVDTQYRNLLAEHELLKTERDTLAAENERLMSNSELSFMFYGALLIILGMIIAIVLPYLKRKKRYNDWAN